MTTRPDDEGGPGQAGGEHGAELVGAPAAEQEDRGTEQRQRDEQPRAGRDAAGRVASAAVTVATRNE